MPIPTAEKWYPPSPHERHPGFKIDNAALECFIHLAGNRANAMDWKTFIAEIVKALAWPALVTLLFLIFRDSIAALLMKMTRFRYKDFEAEFGRVLEQETRKADEAGLPQPTVEPERLRAAVPLGPDYLLQLAELAPSAAVMEAWRSVELALQAAATRLGLQAPEPAHHQLSTRLLGQIVTYLGADRGKVFASIVNQLRRLRNEVAHRAETELTVSQAKDYVRLALRAVKTLDDLQPPAGQTVAPSGS